ncbi:MAG: hypothetical protein QW705_06505 [Zestosphaera sp.]
MKGYVVAGVVGWLLHTFYDAPLYSEMMPLYPAQVNILYDAIPYHILHGIYTTLLYAGALTYLAHLLKTNSNKYGVDVALMQTGLLLVLLGLWLMIVPGLTAFLLSVAMTAVGLLAFYMQFMKIALPWRSRVTLSMLSTLIALLTFSAGFALHLPDWNANIKVLMSIISRSYLTLLIIPWISTLIGLLLLIHPLRELARRTSDSTLRRLAIMLPVSWLLTILLVGVLMLSLAVILLAANIIKVRHCRAGNWP